MSGEFYLMQKWFDSRCHFRPMPAPHGPQSPITMTSGRKESHPGLQNLWQPDTQVLNSRKTKIRESTVQIWASGYVSLIQNRLNCSRRSDDCSTAQSCPLFLHFKYSTVAIGYSDRPPSRGVRSL